LIHTTRHPKRLWASPVSSKSHEGTRAISLHLRPAKISEVPAAVVPKSVESHAVSFCARKPHPDQRKIWTENPKGPEAYNPASRNLQGDFDPKVVVVGGGV
jgi:hypothetical protein